MAGGGAQGEGRRRDGEDLEKTAKMVNLKNAMQGRIAR
jgi:hypothetical protein